MALDNYKDFAENDYKYFMACVKNGMVANMMGAIAQGICEKYIKHIIQEYYNPKTSDEQKNMDFVMKTHSLNRLIKFIKNEMGIQFSVQTRNSMKIIDGFYFSARYPGEDSVELDADDIEECSEAVNACRSEVLYIEKKLSDKIG